MAREREEPNQSLYLRPETQLIIASKVNRLCNAEKEDFDEELINDATEIVQMLDPRIKFSSNYQLTGTKRSSGDDMVGATEHGTYQVSTGEKEKKLRLGVSEYRVGAYIATKTKNGKLFGISFDPFFGAGYSNLILQKHKPRTTIHYKSDSLEVVEITKDIPFVKTIMFFSIVIHRPIIFWSKKKSKK